MIMVKKSKIIKNKSCELIYKKIQDLSIKLKFIYISRISTIFNISNILQ